MPSRSLQ